MERPPDEITVPIAEAASDALNTPMEELPPLSDSISLDGLNAIVTGSSAHDVTITFRYAGLRVLVHSGSTVYVSPIREERTDAPIPEHTGEE